MKTFLKIISAIGLLAALILAVIAAQIYFYDSSAETDSADAAVVLGAAVWGERLSPVFQERVNHAINLYRAKRVRKLIFTGGRGNADEETEASAARRFALESGIPAADILTEEKSTSTYENLLFTKPVLESNGIKTVLLVSDPLHLKRSIEIAESLDYQAKPSPTPTTKYQSFSSKIRFLTRETYFYARFLLEGV